MTDYAAMADVIENLHVLLGDEIRRRGVARREAARQIGVNETMLHHYLSAGSTSGRHRSGLRGTGAVLVCKILRWMAADEAPPCLAWSGWHDDGDPMLCDRPVGHSGDHSHPTVGSWAPGTLAAQETADEGPECSDWSGRVIRLVGRAAQETDR